MHPAHQTIISAVIRKAEDVCPDSLALIGVYGSAATGDLHDKSDLDLLILINDDRGWQLSEGFILEDTGIGYDIYCTNWDMLESDARCEHAQLSKLMDSRIVYVKDPVAAQWLETLRKETAERLASEARFEKSQAALDNAKKAYADCVLSEDLGQSRFFAGAAIHCLLDAVMLFHGSYFHRGVKRTFEELQALHLPFDMPALVLSVIRAAAPDAVRAALTQLMRAVQAHINLPQEKHAPDRSLSGTYEEMFSNWRNKMPEAAMNDDVFSSFMNLLSFQFMLREIVADVEMEPVGVMDRFDPQNLHHNAALYDEALSHYLEVYQKAGITPKRYANAEEFAAAYLGKKA